MTGPLWQQLLQFLATTIGGSMGSYIIGKWINRRSRRREQQVFAQLPVLKELKRGQVITVGLENGEILADVAFSDVFGSKITLATDKRFDEKLRTEAYHKLLKVRVKDVQWIKG